LPGSSGLGWLTLTLEPHIVPRCPHWFVALLALGAAAGLHAQRSAGRSVLKGTVRDSAGGHVARASVCVTLPSEQPQWLACDDADDRTGAYRVENLPAGRLRTSVLCTTLGRSVTDIARDHIAFLDTVPVRRDWAVSTRDCDPRPLRSLPGTFRGYFKPGFESSEFVPCRSDAWFLPGDSLPTEPYDQRRAWAILERNSLPDGFVWPRVLRDHDQYPRYYVEWRGTVVGPGQYGHMGGSAFEIHVDSVLVLRAPREDDCHPVH
jgi:hypothetical protein